LFNFEQTKTTKNEQTTTNNKTKTGQNKTDNKYNKQKQTTTNQSIHIIQQLDKNKFFDLSNSFIEMSVDLARLPPSTIVVRVLLMDGGTIELPLQPNSTFADGKNNNNIITTIQLIMRMRFHLCRSIRKFFVGFVFVFV
jgi:hypothetical protein